MTTTNPLMTEPLEGRKQLYTCRILRKYGESLRKYGTLHQTYDYLAFSDITGSNTNT